MKKKTINLKEASFTQAINISAQWCKEWTEDVLSEEVLADRIAELTKTRNGVRGSSPNLSNNSVTNPFRVSSNPLLNLVNQSISSIDI